METLNYYLRIVVAIIILGFINISYSQISNSSFEEWEEITYVGPSGTYTYEKPIGWETNQNVGHERLQKSTDSQSGVFSLKLFSSTNSAWNTCHSQVTTNVDFSNPIEPNKSLFFYYKSIPDNNNGNVYFKVSISFYQNGVLVNQVNWSSFIETLDYTLVEIPLIPDSDNIFITILGGAISGANDLCHSKSTIWIDNLSIGDSILSTGNNKFNNSITLYPNPVQDVLNIEYNTATQIENITIYNPLGEIVTNIKTVTDKSNVSYLKSGVYMLQITTDKGVVSKKIMKE